MAENKQASNAGNLTELEIEGMTCNNCARHVTEALQGVPEIASAGVSLESGRASVRWRPNVEPDLKAAVQAVSDAGYSASVVDEHEGHSLGSSWSPLKGWRFNAIFGSACFAILLIGEWFFRLGMERWFQWFSLVLATLVQIFCGARFYRGAWNQLKVGSSSMDTLVALGSTTAFAYSVWALFGAHQTHLYFMEAVGIITLISVGHWMEARVSSRASSSLQALLQLAPEIARIRLNDLSEKEIPVADLKPNDRVVLRPGNRVPTDGRVAEGSATLNESMLTGESVPVDKKIGDTLYAGTVNLNGHLVMEVTATGNSTALANIIAAVQRAQTSRADIQRLADRVSNVFVPIVVLIAIATALWWGLGFGHASGIHKILSNYLWPAHLPQTATAAAFIFAAGVLIIACPCAMGLATPVAIMAGTNVAARRGILIRDGIALEKAGKITAALFDKTGTLTAGKPVVTTTEIVEKISSQPDFELKLASALARRSNHPLSQTVAKLHPEEFAFSNWQEIRGSGVQAQIQLDRNSFKFSTARLGSLAWLKKSGVAENPNAFAETQMNQGATILGLAVDQKLVALIALLDTLKPGAANVARQLKNQNLHVYLITGDNQRTAKTIAEQAGIPAENVFAEVRPEDKARFVQKLQERGEKIAFVGDGINDAPALEQADLGIAVSQASDVANEAADIILLKSEIEAIPETLGLAQATLRTIKQNLFWAFFYNAVGIPLAALGFLSPILCAAAMGFSDLIVIGNALRLRRWKLPMK